MALQDVKVLYATAPGGIRATIPLIRAGAYDVADITQRLKAAGVRDQDLPFVVFSAVDPSSLPRRPRLANAMGTPPQLVPPPIPVPTVPNTVPPLYSDLVMVAAQPVTAEWRALTNLRYCMKRTDNNGYVSVQDLDAQSFQNADDYDKVRSGRIKLCYGLVWRQPVSPQILIAGARWSQKVETTHGMSTTNAVSVTASVGYSSGGVSASLSATYNYTVTVDDQVKVTTEVEVDGQPGKTITAVLWELCRKYVVTVDGVVRDEANPFTLNYLDKGSAHQLQDTWGPTYEVISREATLMPTAFNLS